jgi:hypothetical protein
MATAWSKGIKFPEKTGEKHHGWKGGKNHCSSCGKLLSNRVAKRCKSCVLIGNKRSAGLFKEKRYNYIKDRTKVKRQEERNNPNDKQWKYAVYKRDNFICRINNQDCSGRIEAHHILSWNDYPELRFNINNGITLCHAHHPKKRAEEKRLSPFFMNLVSVSKE